MAEKFKTVVVQHALTAVAIVCITILAALKIVSGDMALGVIAGAVINGGASFFGGGNKGAPPAVILTLVVGTALLLGGTQ